MAPISPVFSNMYSSVSKYRWSGKNTDPLEARRAKSVDFQHDLPWIKDRVLETALDEVYDLTFDPHDVKYIENLGIELPFKSGKECVDFIKKENIRICFAKPYEKSIHAQYSFEHNAIMINKRYDKTKDFAVMLAIGEAILHEAGHAKDKDGQSSIQEELNFLGMNAVAHRAFIKKYSDIFSESTAPIVCDGVSVYAKLFFEPDPEKKNLIARIKQKYGDLPTGDRLHPPGVIAKAAVQ